MARVLMVLTSHDHLGDTGGKTGYFLSEAAHPYLMFVQNNWEVDFASPRGGPAPCDPASKTDGDTHCVQFLRDPDVSRKINNTLKPEDISPEDNAAIFFVGGHGTMWDFPENRALSELTARIYENGGIVGAVCHGPAALMNVELSDGTHLVAGKQMTSFTDAEEKEVGKEKIVPFLLQSKLEERGGLFFEAPKFEENVICDGRLFTGQNPVSALGVGKEMVCRLEKYRMEHEEGRRSA